MFGLNGFKRSGNGSKAEAKDQILNKDSKIESARQAILINQLKQIAEQEIRDTQAMKRKHLGPEFGKGTDSEMGDLIVCDDYRKNDGPAPRDNSLAKTLILAAAIAAGATGFGYFQSQAPPTPQQSAPAPPREFRINWWMEDGKIKTEVKPEKN